MIIDGRAIAEGIYSALAGVHAGQAMPKLGIVVADRDPVIDSFVRIKEKAAERLGIQLLREHLPDEATTDDAIAAVRTLAEKTSGIIVQLPLPKQIDTDAVLAAIPPEKDVDGISIAPKVRPPVAEAIAEILNYAAVKTEGKKAVVIGSGRLVGKPAAELLTKLGAEVSVITRGDSLDALADADIVVSGAGEPALIHSKHLKQGVVLIDAGTSDAGASADRRIVGDADPACFNVASVFTPVPGGVGPIAVAMIFKNLFKLTR